jgi:phosphoribosylanthranilate isomerase
MINGIWVKVCGITSRVDAEAASAAGADFLGFIFYHKSPRYLSLEAFRTMRAELPAGPKKVAVVVYTDMDDLHKYRAAGFDYVQLHFPNDTSFIEVAQWTDIIPPHTLWLAPRVPPGKEMDPAFFPLADHVLVDTYHDGGHGGSGKTGNWADFARMRERFVKVNWVLAGGLTPENVAEALKVSGTKYVDVNSGVESSPGVKDHAKITAFMEAIRSATSAAAPA